MRFPGRNDRPRARFLSALAFSTLLLMAAACGGGGGGGAAPAGGGPAVPAYVRFAALSGATEVPANASTATGAATFSLDPATKILTGTVTTSGITGVSAHIHEGARGVSGPIVFPLSGGSNGVWTVPANTVLTDAQYATLQATNYYVNVHSSAFTGGEIRGQIELRASFAILTAAQEVPATTSAAAGYGSLAVNALTGAVYGSVITSGITGTGAHIHEAATGVAGSIIIPLADAGGGVWTVPAGATLTTAQGTGAVGINPITLELSGGAATTGMTGTGAHIHEAPAGVSGPIIVPLTNAGGGAWLVPPGTRFTSGQFASWRAGSLYLNVHSATYPSGEIRGQLPSVPGGGGGTGGGTGGGGY